MSEPNSDNFYLYNISLRSFAVENRNASTKSEACLWKYVLKNKKMKGYPFLRQRPVLNYIADFLCKELNLIIELDGITHSYETVVAQDEVRQQRLEAAGFTVLRFTDEEVLKHINRVRERIEECIEGLEGI